MTRRHNTLLGILLVLALTTFTASLTAAGKTPQEAAVDAWLEAWNVGSGELDRFLTKGVDFEEPFYRSHDRHGYGELMRIGLAPFSGIEFTVMDFILDGDRGAVTWHVTGLHNDSNRPVDIYGVSILRFEGGKIAWEWRIYDAAELLRQIGAMPERDGDTK